MNLSFSRRLLAATAIVALAGCAAKQANVDPAVRQPTAVELPDHFMTLTASGPVAPRPDEGCRNPLVDPRNDTRLTLIRSSEGRGDYEPVPLSYGLTKGQLLRIDCATGRTVGVVRR